MDNKRGFRIRRIQKFSSKGQITVFLIIAVVLVFLIGGYFLFQNYINRSKFATDIADPSLTPVQKYVLGCIDQSLRSGVQLAADQGGYITVPQEIASNHQLYVSQNPDAPLKTPVWIAPGGQSFVPSQQTVESQLAAHIDDTIGACLQNLSAIAEIGDVNVFSAPIAQVSLDEKDIAVTLNYSVSYTQKDKTLTESQFSYVLAVPLRQMIEQAQIVAQKLYDQEFLPLATIDLMSAADPQIPMSNMELKCSTPTWKVDAVRSNITQLLSQMIPRVRILGGEGIPFDSPDAAYQSLQKITPDDFSQPALDASPIKQMVPAGYANAPADSYEYNHLLFDAGNSDTLKQDGFSVSLDYAPTYGLDMQVRPSENGIMSGTSGQGQRDFLSFFCLQVYHFTYDLVFPVEVSLVKESAFTDGSSLALRFALPVQIQQNVPNQDSSLALTPTVDTPGGQLCVNRVGYPTQISAVDRLSNLPINGAAVEFHCYKYSCDLGTTSNNESYSPQLLAAIPSFCSGGSVAVSAPGYIPNEVAFYSAPQQLVVKMFPLQNISFKVMLGPNPTYLNAGVSASELNANEQAIVQLTSNEIDYQTSAAYAPDGSTLDILPVVAAKGTYNVTVLVYQTTDGQDASLIGGYIGELNVSNADLRHNLIFYANDYINPVPSDQVADKMQELATDDVIKASHQPGWV